VTPDGKCIVVSGKLDTHVSVYSFEKIQAAIKAGKFESKDPYGIPGHRHEGRPAHPGPLGLGPLHTQYDSKACVAYTSLYVDSQVAKWNFCEGKVLDKISVHYNIGHLMTMEGDMDQAGRQVPGRAEQAGDRPLRAGRPAAPAEPPADRHLRNDKMQLLYDMPLPLGEPHYAVAIAANKLKPGVRYKVGTDSRTDKPHPGAVRAGEERPRRRATRSRSSAR
jgi:nitrous-oxide reductase